MTSLLFKIKVITRPPNSSTFTFFKILKHFSTKTDKEALLRIGRSVRNIPEDYRHFFTRPGPTVIDETPYDANLKFIVHLNEGLMGNSPELSEKLKLNFLVVEGKRRVGMFLWRLRWMMKWGHFFWRLSDLNFVKIEAVRVIKPHKLDLEMNNNFSGDDGVEEIGKIEMRVYWELKVLINRDDENFVYIDGKETLMNFRSLLSVQMARLRSLINKVETDNNTSLFRDQKILFTGINRYVFDTTTGHCRELHVERVEPPIDQREWKWRTVGWFNDRKIEVGREAAAL